MSKIDDFLHEVDCYDSHFYRENGGEQAAAELAQLRAELEINKANLESFMQLQAENKKLCDLLAERYGVYLKVCAELAEARKVIEQLFEASDAFVASRECPAG